MVMNDYDGLLKLLRSSECQNGCGTAKVCVCAYMGDAADAIDGLRAEVAILKDAMYEALNNAIDRIDYTCACPDCKDTLTPVEEILRKALEAKP